jgi:hypothetical protein
MILEIERKDKKGNITNLQEKMPWLAYIKHMAISGQSFSPFINKLKKMLGMFFVYSDYLGLSSYRNSSFSKPAPPFYDQTTTAQFSNIAGKAIADFLAKKLDKAIISFNYDAALKISGLPVQGIRPDLLCANSTDIFSIEAKGFSKINVSQNEMDGYKQQARSGPIRVKFCVASVSYNIYNKVKVKYYDPINNSFVQNGELVKKLTIQYYQGIKQFLDEKVFAIKQEIINDNNYYKLTFPSKDLYKLFPLCPFFYRYINRLSILIDVRISNFVENGIGNSKMGQYFSNENVYIDSDGVGLMLL